MNRETAKELLQKAKDIEDAEKLIDDIFNYFEIDDIDCTQKPLHQALADNDELYYSNADTYDFMCSDR